MDDLELIAQATSLVPVYVDGFGAFRKANGVFRAVGYVLDSGAALNLIVSLAGADLANRESRRVLDAKAATSALRIWNGAALAH